MITVTIPVGPDPAYKPMFLEALESLMEQDRRPDEILIIDDQAHLEDMQGDIFAILYGRLIPYSGTYHTWNTPWLAGPAHAFNSGVALASNPLVFMMGSDDSLLSWCLEDCMKAWDKYNDPLGYYWTDIKYSTGEEQRLPCHAAMVHKNLWQVTGGFPIASAVGAMDHIFVSMMMAQSPGNLIHVESKDGPPYYYRVHDRTFTNQNKAYHPAVEIVRDHFTTHWEKPTWPKIWPKPQ